MKKIIIAAICLTTVLLLAACGKAETQNPTAPYVPSTPKVSEQPEVAASPELPAPEASPQADERIAAEALEIAATYRDMYLDISQNDTVGVNLNTEQLQNFVAHFEAAGLTVMGISDSTAMKNPKALENYFSSDQGSAETLVIYEICLDGGFVRHDISGAEGARRITLTRLAWENCEALVTYSKEYEITLLQFENGVLTYDYYMPENPQGTNHDGHIDTVKNFKIY